MPDVLSRDEIKTQLTSVFRKVFDNAKIDISDAMTAKDIKRWDSLNHINLIIATEQHFGVKFKTVEISRLQNVGQFIDSLQTKLQQKSR